MHGIIIIELILLQSKKALPTLLSLFSGREWKILCLRR